MFDARKRDFLAFFIRSPSLPAVDAFWHPRMLTSGIFSSTRLLSSLVQLLEFYWRKRQKVLPSLSVYIVYTSAREGGRKDVGVWSQSISEQIAAARHVCEKLTFVCLFANRKDIISFRYK
jgi:hypothetical protein